MAASAIVEIRDGAGPWVDTDDGVDVTAGNVISIRLKTPGDVSQWRLDCFGTDEITATKPTLNNVNPVDNQVTSPSTVVTFTMPPGTDGRALVFKSVADGGGPGLTTTFGIYVLTPDGDRVGAVGETREGSKDFGWVTKLNPLLRGNGPGGGSGDATSIQGVPVDAAAPTLSTPVLVFDGTKYLASALTADMILPAFAVSMGGSQTLEVGATVNTPAFTASYTSGPPTQVILSDNAGNPTKDVTSTPTAFASDHNFTRTAIGASVTFTTTANKGAIQKTSSASITWLPKVFYGVATPGAGDEAFIEALATAVLAGGRGRTFTVNAGPGQKIYYAYPASFGAGTFFVGGFEGGFVEVGASISVTNGFGVTITYRLYESTNAGLGNTTVQVT